jgi:nucleotide-binding universal stress UspA family protein
VSEIRLGIAPEQLVEESSTAALIVVGSHGLGGLRGVLIGSVALKVAAQALCPVIVVRGPVTPAGGPIVVGVDDSAESEQAVEFAMEAACVRKAPLVVVHAWHDEFLPTAGPAPAGAELRERYALENRMDSWRVQYPEVDVRVSAVRDRDAARAMLGHAAGAQLLVVGSRGRGPIAGGLLGSTGNTLLSTAPCPVAVVHKRRSRER